MIRTHRRLAGAALAVALLAVGPFAAAPALGQAPTPFPSPPPLPEADSGTRSRMHLAEEYQREGRWEEALDLWREVVASDPDQVQARRGLKQALLELKRYDELRGLLERELATWGEQPQILEELGTVAARLGERDEAAAIWRRILDVQDHSRGAYSFVADLMVRQRMLDEALAVYAEADRRYPGRFLRQMASLYELRFEFDAATEAYLRFLAISPTSLSYVEGRLLRIGESEEGLGPVVDRIERWLAAARAGADDGSRDDASAAVPGDGFDGPGDPLPSAATHVVFRKLLGDLYLEAGDHEGARREYFRLVDEVPGQHSALLVFGKRCQADGEHEVAIRVFERIVEDIDDPRVVPTALSEIATSQAAMGHWDDALATLARIIDGWPETDWALDARFRSGLALREGRRDPAAAEAVFRELLRLPAGPWPEAAPQFEVAECAVWRGDLDTAASIYRAIRERRFGEDTLERALYEEGRVRLYAGETAVADSLFKQVAQAHPKGLHVNDALELSILINTNEDGEAILGRYAEARLKMRTGDPSGAVAVLEALDRDEPTAAIHDEALLLLGEAYRAAGRSDRALAALERAVAEAQVMDLAAEARFLRGAILAEDLRDPAAALAEYEELLVTYPETLAADRARDLTADLTRALP